MSDYGSSDCSGGLRSGGGGGGGAPSYGCRPFECIFAAEGGLSWAKKGGRMDQGALQRGWEVIRPVSSVMPRWYWARVGLQGGMRGGGGVSVGGNSGMSVPPFAVAACAPHGVLCGVPSPAGAHRPHFRSFPDHEDPPPPMRETVTQGRAGRPTSDMVTGCGTTAQGPTGDEGAVMGKWMPSFVSCKGDGPFDAI